MCDGPHHEDAGRCGHVKRTQFPVLVLGDRINDRNSRTQTESETESGTGGARSPTTSRGRVGTQGRRRSFVGPLAEALLRLRSADARGSAGRNGSHCRIPARRCRILALVAGGTGRHTDGTQSASLRRAAVHQERTVTYVESNLMPGEKVIYRAHLHGIVYASAVVVAVVGLLFWIGVSWGAGLAFLFVAAVGWLGAYIKVRNSEFVVTDQC